MSYSWRANGLCGDALVGSAITFAFSRTSKAIITTSTTTLLSTLHIHWIIWSATCFIKVAGAGIVSKWAAELSLDIMASLNGERITTSFPFFANSTIAVRQWLGTTSSSFIVITLPHRFPHLAVVGVIGAFTRSRREITFVAGRTAIRISFATISTLWVLRENIHNKSK